MLETWREQYYFEKLLSLPTMFCQMLMLRSSWASLELFTMLERTSLRNQTVICKDFFGFVKVAPTFLSMIVGHGPIYAWC